ncbi:MAG TPA: hypothetical protein VFI91_02270 [Longimicrobiaceae bacterium]|nr:hypothetical protein [Longimicrobiaceae bacterium]
MVKVGLFALAAAVALAACDSGQVANSAPRRTAPDSIAPTGEWVTVLERDLEGKHTRPEPFIVSSDSVRVITTLEPAVSEYIPGRVITNLLSDSSALAVATIRAEQRRLTVTTADTAVVAVPTGDLDFFVAEHRGLTGWTVTIQEFRPFQK